MGKVRRGSGARTLAPPLPPENDKRKGTRKVDIRLPGKGNSNTHGARPVHLIITMRKCIRTRRLPIKNSLYI